MKTTFLILILSICISVDAYAKVKIVPCGTEWINIHKNNPDLIGVYKRQLPDNLADQEVYKDKHPALIVFVFKNNKAHQVGYTPSGQITTGFWYTLKENDRLYELISTDIKVDTDCEYWKNEKNT